MADVYEAEHGAPLLVYPGHCFCLGDERVEAKEYYTDKLNQLRPRVSMERNNALHSKLSIGFITFSKEEAAEESVKQNHCVFAVQFGLLVIYLG